MRIRIILVASLLTAALIFLPVAGAQAHSLLVNSNPSSGAQVATSPPTVQMTFSEGVEPAFSSFVVIDRARKHYEAGAPVIDRVKGLVTLPLKPNLAPGNYVVQWKVVSVVDGHLTIGSFAFGVLPPGGTSGGTTSASTPSAPPSGPGAGTSTGATPEPTSEALPDSLLPSDSSTTGESIAPGIPDVAVRWLDTLLAASVVGGAIFGLLIVPGVIGRLPEAPQPPTDPQDQGQEEREEIRTRLEMRFVYGALVATLLLMLTLGAELVLQAMRITETDLGAVFSQPDVFGAILGSSFGLSLEMRALAALAMAALLLVGLAMRRVGRRLTWLWALLVSLGAGYFWAQTGSAHATALGEQSDAGILQVLAPLANLLHLLSTAVWIGGIFYFVVILLPVLRGLTPIGRAALLRESIARFSQIALVAVPVVALSGTVIYLAEQPSVASTLNTDYGREVLIKVGLLAVLMIPAAYNLRRVGPGLMRLREILSKTSRSPEERRGKIGPAFQALAKGFRRSVRIEALLVSTVLIFSALLTLSAPATDPSVYAGNASTPVAVADVPTQLPVNSPTPSAPQATATTPPPAIVTLTQTVRGVDLSLTVVHSQVDDLSVSLRGAKGVITACGPTPAAGVDCALTVKVTLTELDDNASNTVEALPGGTGSSGPSFAGSGPFAVPEGPYLPFDGPWQIVVAVRRYNQPDDLKAAFRIDPEGASMTGKISDYINVDSSTNPDPPRSGPMSLTFHLTDNNGQPINDATITVQGLMPAHGHVTEAKQMSNSAGTYTADLLMPMSGGWSLELSISRPGHDTVAAEVALDLASSSFDLTPYPSPNSTPVGP